MMPMKPLIKTILKRTLPLGLRPRFARRRPTGIDGATWDREYATGHWARLGEMGEMPRYALIAGYVRSIGSAASVLDIGCGDGQLFDWLGQDNKRRYAGVDVSTVAIDQARLRTSNEAGFEVADATTFDPGAQFDIIVLNEMLYYMDRPEEVVQRYQGFLKPGGVLIISMWEAPESQRTWRRCASRLEVLDKVRLRGGNAKGWNIWLCRPRQLQVGNAA
jgi:2-polyprenyl-3-methyl-5-hydroxy-6-metoxy-1,4-benzoquinol methylase